MPFLSEFTEYKRRLANLIVKDEMCVELLTGEKGHKLPAADLIGKNVFLYESSVSRLTNNMQQARLHETLICIFTSACIKTL